MLCLCNSYSLNPKPTVIPFKDIVEPSRLFILQIYGCLWMEAFPLQHHILLGPTLLHLRIPSLYDALHSQSHFLLCHSKQRHYLRFSLPYACLISNLSRFRAIQVNKQVDIYSSPLTVGQEQTGLHSPSGAPGHFLQH